MNYLLLIVLVVAVEVLLNFDLEIIFIKKGEVFFASPFLISIYF